MTLEPNSNRRAVPEWIGAMPESVIPPRVKERILIAQDHRCANCSNVFHARLRPEFDHITALINGGTNRDGNLQALCDLCHAPKTVGDVALKSTVARKKAKHLNLNNRPKVPVGGWAAKKFKKMPDGRVVDRVTGEEVARK